MMREIGVHIDIHTLWTHVGRLSTFCKAIIASPFRSSLGESQGLERLKAAILRFGAESKKVQAGLSGHASQPQKKKHLSQSTCPKPHEVPVKI